jgi:hypothetical protein
MTQPNGSDSQPTRQRYPVTALLGLGAVILVLVVLALCNTPAPERPAPELLAPTPLPTAVLS